MQTRIGKGDIVMIKQLTSIVARAFIFITCALGFGGFVSGAPSANVLSVQDAPPRVSDAMTARQGIVTLRQAMLEEIAQSHRSGRAGLTELSQAKIKLAEARLHLAEAQEKRDEVQRELRTILAVHQDTLNTLKHRRVRGRVSQHELHEARIAVLEAEIRLTRHSQVTA